MFYKILIFLKKKKELKKSIFIFFAFALALTSCVSVKKYNQRLETPVSAENLKKDVDFAYEKLQKLHPSLYWYISKNELDKKFDSLKTTINTPLNPKEFYLKLQPVVSKIREGHLRVSIPQKRLTKKETKNLKNQKGLFSRMNYVVDNDRIFVKDNADKFENIAVGTEILKIKDIPTKEYLERYKKLINSDGYNETFQKYWLARVWANFFTVENGILDSVKITTKLNSETKDFYIHRFKKTKAEKEAEKKDEKRDVVKKTKDYNPATKDYNRDLKFLTKDSAVAYMKIKTFSGTYSKKFYKESFEKIKNAKSEYLILDIRNNLGGSLYEINNLYSYLALEKFEFIKDIEVTSGSSLFHADYFTGLPKVAIPFAALGYPIYFTITALSNKEKSGKHYLRNNGIFAIKNPKKNAFKGKLYVLINGSSFSAASTLPAKIKGDKRGFLVGEETGGANDGTVAGRYSTQKLPNSKLQIPIGLMLIQPNIELANTQKGVVPDKEIVPTLLEVLQKKDIQLDWILKEAIHKE